MSVSTQKRVGNGRKNSVQHFANVKKLVVGNMPNLTNMPNQKYLRKPPLKNAKFQKFGIKVCQLATLFLCRLEIAAAELRPLFRHKG